MVEIAQLELTGRDAAKLDEKRRLLARVEELHEFNPMLGSARLPVGHHHAGNYAHAGTGGRGSSLRTGEGREEDRPGDYDSLGQHGVRNEVSERISSAKLPRRR